MEQHMKVSDMPAFCSEINGWLSGRYGAGRTDLGSNLQTI